MQENIHYNGCTFLSAKNFPYKFGSTLCSSSTKYTGVSAPYYIVNGALSPAISVLTHPGQRE